MQSLDPSLVATAVNIAVKENPQPINLYLKNMDAKALANLTDHVLKNNKTLLVALLNSIDDRLCAVWLTR